MQANQQYLSEEKWTKSLILALQYQTSGLKLTNITTQNTS